MFSKRVFLVPFIALTCIITTTTFAQQEIPAFDFLRVDPSARASALAGAFDAYVDDPNAMFYNPASVSTATTKSVSAGFGKYLLDINFGTLAYTMKYKDIGWFGVGVKYFNYGTFQYTDENANPTGGTFSANDIMFSATYSNFFYEKFNYGITLKYIYSNIATYNSSAIAADIGVLYYIPDEDMAISFTMNNIGQQLYSYMTTKERLPLDVRVGFSKKLEHVPLRLSVTFARLNESQTTLSKHFEAFSIGGEFNFGENVLARIGYDNLYRQDLELGNSLGLSGFSTGLGIKILNKYRVDYSLNLLGKVGDLHRVNIGYAF